MRRSASMRPAARPRPAVGLKMMHISGVATAVFLPDGPARTDRRGRPSLVGGSERLRYTDADEPPRAEAILFNSYQRTHMQSYHGLLVVDKPGGLTSRAVVDRALRWFPRGTRMGHTGTLDPLATGVLVLCVGSATRLTEYVQDMGKTYTSTFLLGATSDTDDAD